jgi:Domain of unknown function (DUF4838)/Glycosyl hydrolase family 67 N-terminus
VDFRSVHSWVVQSVARNRGEYPKRHFLIGFDGVMPGFPSLASGFRGLLGLALGFFVLNLGAMLLAEPLQLRNGSSGLPIVTAPSASPVDRFAASELARYLKQMTGADFAVQSGVPIRSSALVVGRGAVATLDPRLSQQQLGEDGFIIRRLGARVLIAGSSDRGTLYGVYAFLEKLGCRWFAPNFAFYGAAGGELVPHVSAPEIGDWNLVERPAFRWRKLYIEEGWSHTQENLKEMIDWMAKMRMNVLDCPIDYQHLHRTEWDRWREALIPELRKRGILVEVGGHGYPNFLPPEKYFAQHPEWFGVWHGKRSSDPRVVFSTANKDAVRTFIANVKSYLSAHPEIDILDVWPPDGAQWSEAPEDVALGNPSERQMLLLNQLADSLKPDFPRVKFQFIAYATYIAPPSLYKPAPGVVMDFCPIDRSFESPLYESGYARNEQYFHELEDWMRDGMDASDITIYSYIAKYAWRSLPVLIPHLIVDEARRFQSMGVGGFATYSEPGNWATYELDHYITARALWNPDIETSKALDEYAAKRYGAAGRFVLAYLQLTEDTVVHAIDIPGTQLSVAKQRMLVEQFKPAAALLAQARAAGGQSPAAQVLLAQLEHQYRYVENEMNLRLALLVASQGSARGQLPSLANLLADRSRIIDSDQGDGVILHDSRIP